jgi:8-oxo-dGTP pyrophosphatase MutT (NUDIX family)
MSSALGKVALPLQVAAVCYRRRAAQIQFLLVRNSGGRKWTFPKGAPEPHLSHSQAAEQEALEEAGVLGSIEVRPFHLYLHSKGVFWQPGGVQEYVVKAFLLEVERSLRPLELERDPTWFNPQDAKQVLGKGREVKYAEELKVVIDQALARIGVRNAAPKNGAKGEMRNSI